MSFSDFFRKLHRVALISFVVSVSPTHSFAQLSSVTTATARTTTGGVGDDDYGTCNAISCASSSSVSGEVVFFDSNREAQVSTASMMSSASASYGSLKASAIGSSDFGSPAQAVGFASASFQDNFTINAPGRLGKTGFLVGSIDFAYLMGGTGGLRKVETNVILGTSNVFSVFDIRPSASDVPVNYFLSPNTFGYSFVFGQPIDILASLVVNVGNGNSGTTFVDAGNSLYWGGFISIQDDGGKVINDNEYAVISKSGADYSLSFTPSPVPEPHVYLMMIVGLALLLTQSARRSTVFKVV